MRDLVEVYAEARFGKEAAAAVLPTEPKGIKAYLTMPQLTGEARKIRDAIEASVSKETRLRARAQQLAEYAQRRMKQAPDAGHLGWAHDALRAMIPGLSPAAATDGIEKPAAADETRALDTAHALAAGTGALAGGATLGRLSQAGQYNLLRRLAIGIDPKNVPTEETLKGMAQAGSWRGLPQRLLDKLRGRTPQDTAEFARKALAAAKAPVQTVARSGLLGRLLSRIKGKPGITEAMTHLGTRADLLSKARGLANLKGLIPSTGWGAAKGALLLSLPFFAYRLLKNRQLRARGGTAATEAAQAAEQSIAGAKKLQAWRQQQLEQLQSAVGPGAPKWQPAETPTAPAETAETAKPRDPGVFGQYQLQKFE